MDPAQTSMSPEERRVLTEADVPPKPPPLGKPPCLSAYSTTAEFALAVTAHAELEKQRKAQMKERRRVQMALQEQKRAKRDRSQRSRPSDDGERATRRRKESSELTARHNCREKQRYVDSLPEPSELDIQEAELRPYLPRQVELVRVGGTQLVPFRITDGGLRRPKERTLSSP